MKSPGVKPVMFPPGRAKGPYGPGCYWVNMCRKTIGIVLVCRCGWTYSKSKSTVSKDHVRKIYQLLGRCTDAICVISYPSIVDAHVPSFDQPSS